MATQFPLPIFLFLLLGLLTVGGANARPVYRGNGNPAARAGARVLLWLVLAKAARRALGFWIWAAFVVTLGGYFYLAGTQQVPVKDFGCSTAMASY